METTGNRNNIVYCWLQLYWPCLLVLLAFGGFISKSLYNYPVVLMALLGLYYTIKNPAQLISNKTLFSLLLMFGLLWLPLLFSLPDAFNKSHSAHTVFPYLRFYFAGIFIITVLTTDSRRLNFIIAGIFILVAFWCVDACIQFFFGQNLAGFPYRDGDITGMFYPKNTISHICAVLSPLFFLYCYNKRKEISWLWLLALPLFFIVLLSGRRAAWIMLFLSSIGFVIFLFYSVKQRALLIKATSFITVGILFILMLTTLLHEPTKQRMARTMGLFSGDYETIDKATSRRLPLWHTAIRVFEANTINGIGPRGFRHAYPEYAAKNNYWKSQTHPHLLILEIAAETGLIGLAGYLILLFILLRDSFRSNQLRFLFPFLLPVLIALFPLNSHLAFYGSIWSSMLWLLIALYLAQSMLLAGNKQNTAAHSQ